MRKRHLLQFIALTFFLSLILASTGAAQDVVAVINKQAWKIDPAAGTPAQGYEENFETNRQAGYIEVFRVLGKKPNKPDRVEVYLFQEENGFHIDTTTYSLSLDKDGKFAIYDLGQGQDMNNKWDFEIRDKNTMIQRREMGTFVYRRVPDFNPPRDELTGLMPLPWQPRQ